MPFIDPGISTSVNSTCTSSECASSTASASSAFLASRTGKPASSSSSTAVMRTNGSSSTTRTTGGAMDLQGPTQVTGGCGSRMALSASTSTSRPRQGFGMKVTQSGNSSRRSLAAPEVSTIRIVGQTNIGEDHRDLPSALLETVQRCLGALNLHHIERGFLQQGCCEFPDIGIVLDDQGDVRLRLHRGHAEPPGCPSAAGWLQAVRERALQAHRDT